MAKKSFQQLKKIMTTLLLSKVTTYQTVELRYLRSLFGTKLFQGHFSPDCSCQNLLHCLFVEETIKCYPAGSQK
jgi:hypothetical protein